jgi:hypothetical protein
MAPAEVIKQDRSGPEVVVGNRVPWIDYQKNGTRVLVVGKRNGYSWTPILGKDMFGAVRRVKTGEPSLSLTRGRELRPI